MDAANQEQGPSCLFQFQEGDCILCAGGQALLTVIMDSTNRDREKTPVENEPCSLKSYQEKEDQPLVETLLQTRDLEVCNWEELQEKYANAMDEHSRFEDNLRSQIAQLLQVL